MPTRREFCQAAAGFASSADATKANLDYLSRVLETA